MTWNILGWEREISSPLFHTVHLVLLWFRFFCALKSQLLLFSRLSTLSSLVLVITGHQEGSSCLRRVLACSSPAARSLLGEQASQSGWLRERGEDAKCEFTKFLERNVSVRGDVPQILISWEFSSKHWASTAFSCSSSILKGLRQVKLCKMSSRRSWVHYFRDTSPRGDVWHQFVSVPGPHVPALLGC